MNPNLLSIIIFSISLGIPAMVFESWNEVPSDCKKFFLNGIPPIFKDPGARVKIICQKYENRFHFVTLFDTGNRSAIYSAYNVDPGPDRPDESWKVELGGLGDQNNPCNLGDYMDTAGWLNTPNRSCLPLFQAINQDYIGNGFDKGHLNPNQLQRTPLAKEATFTLTNAVPQRSGFNRGEWKSGETELREITENCLNRHGTAFAVTGAITGHDFIDPYRRINVPILTWSASCCRFGCSLKSNQFVLVTRRTCPQNFIQIRQQVFDISCSKNKQTYRERQTDRGENVISVHLPIFGESARFHRHVEKSLNQKDLL
uniref:Si:ch211-133n4.10 n=1 Tax=Eptatretus burgeri TaxID=7764 RepID=A0A8C4QX03_EPTBU